ncbi:MAG: selenium metabolism-associated LysR family transcriptional regulator [Chloroflexota bacterium]
MNRERMATKDPARGAPTAWLDLNKLRIFAAVAEHEHFSRAAEALAISQPAVSAQVRALEQHYGTALFERAGRGVRLTESGRLVQGYARRILALAVELDEAVSDLQGLRTGQLRVGASTTIGDYLLPPVLGAFRAQYPGIGIALEIANTARIVDRLRHGELHLGLLGEPVAGGDLDAEPYHDDTLVLIVPPAHRWAGRQVALGELSSAVLITRERGSATRAVTEEALAGVGIRLDAGMELGGTEAVKGAVAAGLGVAFVSACAVQQELTSGRLAQATTPGLEIRRQFQLARQRGRQLTSAEKAFLALLHRPPQDTLATE